MWQGGAKNQSRSSRATRRCRANSHPERRFWSKTIGADRLRHGKRRPLIVSFLLHVLSVKNVTGYPLALRRRKRTRSGRPERMLVQFKSPLSTL